MQAVKKTDIEKQEQTEEDTKKRKVDKEIDRERSRLGKRQTATAIDTHRELETLKMTSRH